MLTTSDDEIPVPSVERWINVGWLAAVLVAVVEEINKTLMNLVRQEWEG